MKNQIRNLISEKQDIQKRISTIRDYIDQLNPKNKQEKRVLRNKIDTLLGQKDYILMQINSLV